MLFMVIERFKDRPDSGLQAGCAMPDQNFPRAWPYVGSWIEPNFDRRLSAMECDDLRLCRNGS